MLNSAASCVKRMTQNGEVGLWLRPGTRRAVDSSGRRRVSPTVSAGAGVYIDNWFVRITRSMTQQYPSGEKDSFAVAELDPQLRVQPLSPQRCFLSATPSIHWRSRGRFHSPCRYPSL